MASASPRPETVLLDPIHGSIQLEPYLVKIIDTPEFQRLRKIKQLGGACFVYPGATHTRFEHSIGVCHIAGHLIKELNDRTVPNEDKKNIGDKWFTKEEEMCVKIAALCHDLGHGPYSHVYDHFVGEYYEGKKKPSMKHEYRSVEIVERILRRKDVTDRFNELGHANFILKLDEFIELIQAMITFSEEYKEYEKEKNYERKEKKWKNISAVKSPWFETKTYLFEIVANGFTEIDVDKMDYFARDSQSVGLPNKFDWRRFTQTVKILKITSSGHNEVPQGGLYHICSRDKDAIGLYELFHTRNVLYRTVYCHKSVMIIQHMIKKALKSASSVFQFGPQKCSLLECWCDMNAFLYLDDSIEDLITKSTDITEDKKICVKIPVSSEEPNEMLKESKDYYDRIRKRKLPKFFGRTHDELETYEQIESAHHDTAVCVARTNDDIPAIKDHLVKPLKTTFSYGKGKANPMESHYFYSKLYPNYAYQLPPEEISKFLPKPNEFMETEWLWYYDTIKHDEAVESNPQLIECDDVKFGMWEYFNKGRLPDGFKKDLEECHKIKLKKPQNRTQQDKKKVVDLQKKIDKHRKTLKAEEQ